MRLVTLQSSPETRDGQLAVVSLDGLRAAPVPSYVFGSLLNALENWVAAEPYLRELDQTLAAGRCADVVDLSSAKILAPIPRSYGFLDGSAFLQHVILVRKSRGVPLPDDMESVPLMYQGLSDSFSAPTDPLPCFDPEFGLDFEGEFCVVTDDVPQGVAANEALTHVKLIMLMNDISLRTLAPREVGTGFGFIQSKPASAFAPWAITPDELAGAWRDGKVCLPLRCELNGKLFGEATGAEMHFSFGDLIAHAARTRSLAAGTIIGSGTVSNRDPAVGSSCIVERRMREQLEGVEPLTQYLKVSDRVKISASMDGRSLFGAIDQTVVKV